jgi:thiol-disulfide isomerase/thioredoxin
MAALTAGSLAPEIPGVSFTPGGTVLFFYKVTCPVCQMAAPAVQTFAEAYPGRIVGVGQDPPDALGGFSRRFGMTFPSNQDAPPYPLSDAYGIQVVPTTFLVDATGTIVDTVESWDRDGLNELSRGLAEMAGADYAPISSPGDGLPPFRPG